jgi:hypothetical protein
VRSKVGRARCVHGSESRPVSSSYGGGADASGHADRRWVGIRVWLQRSRLLGDSGAASVRGLDGSGELSSGHVLSVVSRRVLSDQDRFGRGTFLAGIFGRGDAASVAVTSITTLDHLHDQRGFTVLKQPPLAPLEEQRLTGYPYAGPDHVPGCDHSDQPARCRSSTAVRTSDTCGSRSPHPLSGQSEPPSYPASAARTRQGAAGAYVTVRLSRPDHGYLTDGDVWSDRPQRWTSWL